MREVLEASFRAALEATDPYALTQAHLPQERPALVLAVGKAAAPMLRAAEDAYRDVPAAGATRDGHAGGTRTPLR